VFVEAKSYRLSRDNLLDRQSLGNPGRVRRGEFRVPVTIVAARAH
jgi:hypothetical protein